jgi:hypothetical protein
MALHPFPKAYDYPSILTTNDNKLDALSYAKYSMYILKGRSNNNMFSKLIEVGDLELYHGEINALVSEWAGYKTVRKRHTVGKIFMLNKNADETGDHASNLLHNFYGTSGNVGYMLEHMAIFKFSPSFRYDWVLKTWFFSTDETNWVEDETLSKAICKGIITKIMDPEKVKELIDGYRKYPYNEPMPTYTFDDDGNTLKLT